MVIMDCSELISRPFGSFFDVFCFSNRLCQAAVCGNKDMVELLIYARANVNLKGRCVNPRNGRTSFECTPLEAAIVGGSEGQASIVSLLIQAKADVTSKNFIFTSAKHSTISPLMDSILEAQSDHDDSDDKLRFYSNVKLLPACITALVGACADVNIHERCDSYSCVAVGWLPTLSTLCFADCLCSDGTPVFLLFKPIHSAKYNIYYPPLSVTIVPEQDHEISSHPTVFDIFKYMVSHGADPNVSDG